MKIHFIIPWFYPAYKAGGPVRSMYNLVKSLEKNAEIKVIAGDMDLHDKETLKDISIDSWNNFGHSQIFYISSNTSFRNRITFFKRIKTDVLFVNGIYSFLFTIIPIVFIPYKRAIISARGMLHEQALNQKKWKKKLYLFFFKFFIKKFKVEFHATDDIEKQNIKKMFGNQVNVWVAPNFSNVIPYEKKIKKRNKLNLLTVALIGPMKNYKLILDSLRNVKGEVEYDICGPIYFKDYWNECLQIIHSLPSNVKVNYHGSINPNNIETFYQNSHVFICPSQSENYGHAFFESLSCGRPIISSYNTPWQGLFESKSGINVNINKEEISNAIQFFIDMDDSDYLIWSESAKNYSCLRYDIDTIKLSYLKMFRIHL